MRNDLSDAVGEDAGETVHSSSGSWSAALAAAVLALYVLSFGFVNAWAKYHWGSWAESPIFEVIYWPVEWLANNTPLGGPIDWYMEWWEYWVRNWTFPSP